MLKVDKTRVTGKILAQSCGCANASLLVSSSDSVCTRGLGGAGHGVHSPNKSSDFSTTFLEVVIVGWPETEVIYLKTKGDKYKYNNNNSILSGNDNQQISSFYKIFRL